MTKDKKTNSPNLGTKEALEQGCKCPAWDNKHGVGVGAGTDGKPLFWYSSDCELHCSKND